MNLEEILLIERLSFRAFPAETEVMMAGWTLRSTPSDRSRRINSATTPLAGPENLAADLDALEGFYRNRSQHPIARVLSSSLPAIDEALSGRGYDSESETYVMSSELTAAGPDAAVAVDASPSDEWCVCKQSWTGQTPQSMTAWLKRAENIPGDLGCAMLRIDGAPAAIGLGVAEEGWLGVFDVTTQPGQRRRGHATRLMEGINAWGADAGARASYLQVQGDNEPAMQLYRRLGHREKYRYWYRRLSSQHT